MGGDAVRFDADGAAQMLRLLGRLATGDDVPEADLDEVLSTPAYRLFFAHHNRFPGRTLTPAEFAAMLRAIPGGEFATDNPQLSRMWDRFRQVPARLDVLRALHTEVAGGDVVPQALQLARRHLPPEVALDTTILIVLDGMSGGFAYQGQVAFDLLQMRDASWFLKTLAHELHHIGVETLWQGQIEDPAIPAERRRALEFVSMLLGEGSATYLISGPPVEPEGVTQWQEHMDHLDELFARAEDVFRRSLSGEMDEATFQATLPGFVKGYIGEAYAIGYVIVQRIHQVLGDEAVLACLRHLAQTLAVYNQAADRIAGAYRFAPGVAQAVAGGQSTDAVRARDPRAG